MRTQLLALCLIAMAHFTYGQKNEVAFRLSDKELIPEGIAYDAASKTFFLGSIAKKKIVMIDANKTVSDFVPSGQDELGEVLGMKVFNGSLWACSNMPESGKAMVHQFDIASRKLIKKWTLNIPTEKHLFNDLVVLNAKEAMVTDTDAGSLYSVDDASSDPKLFLQDVRLRYINGITTTPDNEFLMVNALTGFLKISVATKEISLLPFKGYYSMGIDGLYWYKQSLIGIQNISFPAAVNQYSLNATFSEVLTAKVLVSNHPDWEIPTTGVIVSDWLYYIANSQVLNYDMGAVKDPTKLKEVLVMRVSLR